MKTAKIKTAKLGNVEATGKTMMEAKQNLQASIEWLAAHSCNQFVECRFGLVGILNAHENGWQYVIVSQDDIAHDRRIHSSCSFGRICWTDALSEMRNAMCQRGWNETVNDAAHVEASQCLPEKKKELARLFAYYRQCNAQG